MVVLATIAFTAITTELLPSGLLPQISEGLNVSEPVAGYLAAAYAAVIVVTVIPAARLLARVPRKTLLVSLVLTFALSNVLVGLAPNFTAAMAARLVGGLAHGLLWTTMAPFVSRVVPADKVGKALAIVFSGNSLGMAMGAPSALRWAGFSAGARPSSSWPASACSSPVWPSGCCRRSAGSPTPSAPPCARPSPSPA